MDFSHIFRGIWRCTNIVFPEIKQDLLFMHKATSELIIIILSSHHSFISFNSIVIAFIPRNGLLLLTDGDIYHLNSSVIVLGQT